jgi:hypothetical protein
VKKCHESREEEGESKGNRKSTLSTDSMERWKERKLDEALGELNRLERGSEEGSRTVSGRRGIESGQVMEEWRDDQKVEWLVRGWDGGMEKLSESK